MFPPKKNLQIIQLLRSLACLLVVLMHIGETYLNTYHSLFLGGIFKFGGSGVDIFFVLSGFIITYSNQQYICKFSSILKYLRKRIIRIFPIYWLIISLLLLMQMVLPSFYRTHYQFTSINLLYTYLLLPNHNMVNGVSWTLTNELFFYILFTVSLILPKKKLILTFLFIYLFALLIIPFLPITHTSINTFADLFLFPMNIEFLLGIIIILCIPILKKELCILLSIIGIFMFVLGAVITNCGIQIFPNIYNRILLFGLPSFLLILALVKYEMSTKIVIPSLFIKLGDASYAIYLFHLPLVAAFFKIMVKLNIINFTEILLLIVFLIVGICYIGIIIFKKIEIPIISWLNQKA